MSRYVSTYVVCPFYSCNNTNRICCEGVSYGNTINVVFESTKDMVRYEQKYCDDLDNHKCCLLYQMLNQKWKEGKG